MLKSTFALFFGNRGFFPGSLMAGAREELSRVLKEWGHDVLIMDDSTTRLGAVETTAEGQVYANWLQAHRGQYDGARPGNDVAVDGSDMRAAVDALLAGSEISAEQIPSVGCNIKWRAGNEPDYF